jgi:hypothetical protein
VVSSSTQKQFSRVFISYAREDSRHAERLYMDLRINEIDAWLDTKCLLPGQNWKREISRAIRESVYFLALISSNSVNKRGTVQTEIKRALEVLSEVPSHQIFLIPVRLDSTTPVDEELQNLNWVNLFPDYKKGLKRLLTVCKDLPKAPIEWQKAPAARAPIEFAPYRTFADLVRDMLDRTGQSSAVADPEHPIYIRFLTNHRGVTIPEELSRAYPFEMQIVLQHLYEELVTTGEAFEAYLHFGGVRTKLVVPYEAIKEITLPSIAARLQNLWHFLEQERMPKKTQKLPARQRKAAQASRQKPDKRASRHMAE